MTANPLHRSLDRLDRELADLSVSTRLYLRPIGLLNGAAAAEVLSDGRACALAGGPLAMSACEVQIRAAQGVRRIAVEIAGLQAWAAARATPAAGRIATLLARIAAPRPGMADGPRLMGIVNVTPDSFSDGGEHVDAATALAYCREMASAGAGILDIGGESTRPGAAPVSPAEELARVLPVLEGLQTMRGDLAGIELSIDTRHSLVMRAATAAGAGIINDVTALTGDPAALAAAAASNARVVLMHMQGEPATMNRSPAYDDVALDVFDFLEARIEACVAAGVDRQRLIVDPGIGFGKRSPENLAILRAITLFHGLGCPILLGVSRKGLGAGMESIPPKQRLPTSLAAAMHALANGVQVLRVHDVAETRQVVELWRRLNDAAV
ncbi:MAG TPA: dihydropteroate synthase [Dongiaceae bacterium]|nr:dihydropteroate synthase [Dongiaceae bacterium]